VTYRALCFDCTHLPAHRDLPARRVNAPHRCERCGQQVSAYYVVEAT
jgi:hypothetical protein